MMSLFRPRPVPPTRTVVDLSDLTRAARKRVMAERLARRTADLRADIAAGRIARLDEGVGGISW